MNEKTKEFITGLCAGIILFGAIGLFSITIITTNYTRTRKQLESSLADRDRQLTELTRELAEARGLVEQRRAVDTELMGTIQQGMAAISAARSEYERALAGVRLAQAVFEKLRRIYDVGDNTASKGTNP